MSDNNNEVAIGINSTNICVQNIQSKSDFHFLLLISMIAYHYIHVQLNLPLLSDLPRSPFTPNICDYGQLFECVKWICGKINL